MLIMTKSKNKIIELNVIVEEEAEGGYSVWVPDLPGCASQGETLSEAIENIKAAAELYLENETEFDASLAQKKQFLLPVRISYA